MRKYMIGLIAGFLLSIGITTYAEDIKEIVGKTVQGTLSVFLNDQKFDVEAIVIDGTSYLPVKEMAERLGLEIKFDPQRGIDLTNKVEQVTQEVEDDTHLIGGNDENIKKNDFKLNLSPKVYESNKEDNNHELDRINQQIAYQEQRIKEFEHKATTYYFIYRDTSQLQQQYNLLLSELEDLKRQKLDLEQQLEP